ncbi:TPA: hypothetical protein DHW58_02220, partial [Patescibacteria group bacterium]|nr:hypothetical protein [Patescibacteria group bacterium]
MRKFELTKTQIPVAKDSPRRLTPAEDWDEFLNGVAVERIARQEQACAETRWVPLDDLPELFDRVELELTMLLNKYHTAHPEAFRGNGKGCNTEVSIMIVEHLKGELDAVTRSAPMDWRDMDELSRWLATDSEMAAHIIKPHLEAHPEWQRTYKDGEFFSPELLELLGAY